MADYIYIWTIQHKYEKDLYWTHVVNTNDPSQEDEYIFLEQPRWARTTTYTIFESKELAVKEARQFLLFDAKIKKQRLKKENYL